MLPRIDTQAEPLELELLVAHIERSWRALGETEPHFSVLSNPRFKSEQIAETTLEAFYASGEGDVVRWKQTAARCSIDIPSWGTCLELGCGVGRVTLWLAKSFRRVVGVDISRSHLAIAKDKLQKHRNIQLRLANDLDAVVNLPRFDFFCSVIDLQHNPPPVIRWMLITILSKLNPGGVAIFQVVTELPKYQFDTKNYLADLPFGQMEMHAIPHDTIIDIIDSVGCELIEVDEHDCVGIEGSTSVEFFVRKRPSVLYSGRAFLLSWWNSFQQGGAARASGQRPLRSAPD